MENNTLDMLQRIAGGESFEDCSKKDSNLIKELRAAGLVKAIDGRSSQGNSWGSVKLASNGKEEMEKLKKIEAKEKEELINKLLILMSKINEEKGDSLESAKFQFLMNDADTKLFLERLNIQDYTDFISLLDYCFANGLVRHLEPYKYQYCCLTTEGQGRAKSVLVAQHTEPKPEISSGSTINIKNFNNNGNALVGNGSIQKITQVFNNIVKDIDDADASEDEKKEAKGLLSKFLEHPLAGTIFGLSVEAAKSICGG